jgi:hypothetical protein
MQHEIDREFLLPAPSRGFGIRIASLFLLTGLVVGCEKVTDEKDAGTVPSDVEILDDNNYRTESTLSPPVIMTTEWTPDEDIEINWADLTVDMQCHDVDPLTDIDKVALLRFRPNTDYDEAATLLTQGELDMSDIDGYLQYDTDHESTTAHFSDLSLFGSAPPDDFYVEGPSKYLLLFGTGTTPGTGARTMIFVEPHATPVAGQTDVVNATSACNPETGDNILTFTATLAEQVQIPESARSIEWRNLTKDGLGNGISFNSIDRVLLAHYENETISSLEEKIFDIELIADDIWEIKPFTGKAADLRSAKHRDTGEYFDGFAAHGDGVWLLGLMCSICQNPAPVVLAVLEPVGE